MVFERGPRAFIEGAIQLIREHVVQGSSMLFFGNSASAHVSERIAILTSLRCSLAIFFSQVSSFNSVEQHTMVLPIYESILYLTCSYMSYLPG